MKKKKNSKTPTKSTKRGTAKTKSALKKTSLSKKTTKDSKKKRPKAFTLIELLAVVIILGVIMIIAIPSVTKYISNSRKNAYIDSAKNIVGSARTLVNSGEIEMYDPNATYYIPISCIKTENGTRSPYGEFTEAYVVVIYNPYGFDYYWTSTDTSQTGIKSLIPFDKLDVKQIEAGVKDTDIKTNVGVDGRKSVIVFSDDCSERSEATEAVGMIDKDGNEIGRPTSFADDELSTIITAVREGNTDAYHVGDTKVLDLGELGEHVVRIANKSNPEECNNQDFSQTACGFVIEFTDSVVKKNMMSSKSNSGGWPNSVVRATSIPQIYDSIPSPLKEAIIDTRVVSGSEKNVTNNYVTTDKLYLLTVPEIYGIEVNYDRVKLTDTRQLDYYNAKIGVLSGRASHYAIKPYNGSNTSSWLRSAYITYNNAFLYLDYQGWYGYHADCYANQMGVSPAFRIG